VSAVWLDDAAREAVHLLKYRGWRRLAPLLADAMRKAVSPVPGTTLLAIPLGATRQRSRGYNQSAVLAESLARALHLPLVSGTLRRIRETGTQTALTPEARRANLAGAFRVEGRVPRRAFLVDDVFTTGATLAEAAGALLAAGAESVGAVTFARAARPLAEALAAPRDQWTRAQWRRA
jgi:ComF family protein